jgi:hypothetical protein
VEFEPRKQSNQILAQISPETVGERVAGLPKGIFPRLFARFVGSDSAILPASTYCAPGHPSAQRSLGSP